MEGIVWDLAGEAAQNVAGLDTPDFWIIAVLLGAVVLGLFYVTFRSLHRARVIDDTPTAKVRSAPQGYVELEGHARRMEGDPVYAPLSGAPCVWYQYQVERHTSDDKNSHWQTVESGVSEAIFHLQDDTGLCIVDPDGAEVHPSLCQIWYGSTPRPPHGPGHGGTGFFGRTLGALLGGGNYRYSESRIQANDPLYALGLFTSTGGDEASVPLSVEVGDLLRQWKRDPEELRRRFDQNGDGQIDLHEWEEARQAAEQVVLKQRAAHPPQPAACVLRKATVGGQPFILAATPQRKLAGRYRLRAFLSMLGFLLCGAGLTWLLAARFGG
jgi:hypothetical protein